MQASSPKKFHPHASFDLHVLGTPPAFILSQDQTLIKSSFRPVPSLTSPSPRMDSLKSGLSGLLFLGCIFQCLFSWIFCQPPLLSADFSARSSGNSFESFKVIPLFSCQGCSLSLLRDNFYILSQYFAFVNNFFIFFCNFLSFKTLTVSDNDLHFSAVALSNECYITMIIQTCQLLF